MVHTHSTVAATGRQLTVRKQVKALASFHTYYRIAQAEEIQLYLQPRSNRLQGPNNLHLLALHAPAPAGHSHSLLNHSLRKACCKAAI